MHVVTALTLVGVDHQPVAGGGNAAHVAAGMFANNGHEVNLFFSFEEEAKAFRTGCEAGDGVTVTYLDESYKGKPSVISADPAEAVPGAEVIVIIAPAYAHEPILKQMQPHVSPGTFLGAIPAPGCFDLLAKHTLGPQFIQDNDITIFGGSSLPWACRTTEYGQSVSLLGAKTVVDVTASPDVAESNDRLAKLLTDFHHVTEYRVGGHFLITSMWPTNCMCVETAARGGVRVTARPSSSPPSSPLAALAWRAASIPEPCTASGTIGTGHPSRRHPCSTKTARRTRAASSRGLTMISSAPSTLWKRR